MALKSNNTSLAIAIQSVVDTFTAPTQPTDIMPISQCRLNTQGVTIANDEYTGSPFRNGDQVVGKRATLSYNVKMRPPGGALPAANAFLLGRIFQAAKFTEVRTTTAIPASAEAGTSGTATALTLGAGATGTADLYKGMPISLVSMGTDYRTRMTAIRAYTAGKVATFMETFGSSVTGNYQIPTHLAYMRSITSADPIILSQSVWIDGYRYDLKNCRVSGLQIVVPTSTKQNPAYPELQVTYDCEIDATADQATPAVTPLGAVPMFKAGDCWFAGKAVGTQSFTIDLGLSTENPPNPNKPDGVDAAELVGGAARVQGTMQKYLKANLDTMALADAQAQNPFWAQWGSAAGAMVQITVTDARVNYPNPDMGGPLVMESLDLLIDAADKNVVIAFPYA